mgnify:CR=1 FL=1
MSIIKINDVLFVRNKPRILFSSADRKVMIYMKLILAIVHDEDGNKVMTELNKQGFSVTKLATTGGFLKTGNMTLLVGTSEQNVSTVIDIIKKKSETRKQIISTPVPMSGLGSGCTPYPVEVEVGGATIFVVDVERFEKV